MAETLSAVGGHRLGSRVTVANMCLQLPWQTCTTRQQLLYLCISKYRKAALQRKIDLASSDQSRLPLAWVAANLLQVLQLQKRPLTSKPGVSSLAADICKEVGGARIACWLERRTRDPKVDLQVASSNPGSSGRRFFFSRVNFVC